MPRPRSRQAACLVTAAMIPASTSAPVALDSPPDSTRVCSDLPDAQSWDALARSSGPTEQHAWSSAAAALFAADSQLRAVVVGSRERPAAIAPLVRRGGTVRRLELLGVRELHEPMDLVYRDAAQLRALTDALVRLGLPIFLPRVPADSPTVRAFQEAWRGRGVVICRPALGCPSLELGERWTQAELPIESGRRSDLRRARRHAEKLGPVRYEIRAPAPGEVEALLDDFLRVEGASWKGKNGTALATDPVQGAFYRRYAAAASRAGALRLAFLWVGERIAAAQLAVETDRRYWLLKIGYDEAFARCSPGLLLIGDTIQDAARQGLRSYEFLGTPEPWIRMWTERVRPCVSIRAYPARPWGIAAIALDLMQAGWRKFVGLGRRAA